MKAQENYFLGGCIALKEKLIHCINNKYLTAICLAFMLLYIYMCNSLYPIMSDDYALSFIWDGEHGGNLAGIKEGHIWQRICNVGDVWQSSKSLYMTWGGRMESWLLAQAFVLWGKSVFNVANTIVFAIFIGLIYKIAIGNTKKHLVFWVWMIFMLHWLTNYAFINTTIWLAGAVNYLWLMVFQLLFILPYVNAMRGEYKTFLDSGAGHFVIFLLGVLAGNTNENSVFAILIAAVYIYYCKHAKWMRYGILGLLAGYLALILAPGNYVRYSIVLTAGEGDFLTWKQKLIVMIWLFAHEWAMVPFIVLCLRKAELCIQYNSTDFHLMKMFCLMGCISAGVMMFSPMFPPRSFYGSVVSFLIAAVIACRMMLISHNGLFKVKSFAAIFVLFSVTGLYTMCVNIFGEVALHTNTKNFEKNYLVSQTHIDVVVNSQDYPLIMDNVSEYEQILCGIHDAYGNCIGHIRSMENQWMNQAVANYYGLKSIRLEK